VLHSIGAENPDRIWPEQDLCKRLGLSTNEAGRSAEIDDWVAGGLKFVEKPDSGNTPGRYFAEKDVLECVQRRLAFQILMANLQCNNKIN
jgi:hypothetical protein